MRPLLILLALALLYGPFAATAGFVYEDHNGTGIYRPWEGVAVESTARCFGQTWIEVLTRPRCLTDASYRFDAWLSGTPRVFHLTSAALHAANVLVLGVVGGWFAAAIVAVHPLTTEAVAYVSARSELVAGAGVLLALASLSTRFWALGTLAGLWLAWQGSALTAVGLLLALPLMDRRTWPGALLVALAGAVLLGPLASEAELTAIGNPFLFIGQQAANTVRLFVQVFVPWSQSIELPAVSGWQMLASVGVLVSGSALAWQARQDWPRLSSAWAMAVALVLPRVLVPRFEGLHERHVYAALIGVAWCLTRQERV